MKTGYDINDPNKRLFKYDDMEVLTSLPPPKIQCVVSG